MAATVPPTRSQEWAPGGGVPQKQFAWVETTWRLGVVAKGKEADKPPLAASGQTIGLRAGLFMLLPP